jgi:hypothetical protein
MVTGRSKGDLTCAGLNATSVDGHDYRLRFGVIGGLSFQDLTPLVTPPPFSICDPFDVVRISIESRH